MTGVPLQLRAYRSSDLEALFRLDEICFEPLFRFSKPTMQSFAEARNAQVLLAEANGQLTGFSVVHLQRALKTRAGYLVTLDVAPAWRRTGVGRMLMRRAEADALAQGCTVMLLHVFSGNEAARSFYESAGYHRADEARNFYAPGVHGLVYCKELGRQPFAKPDAEKGASRAS